MTSSIAPTPPGRTLIVAVAALGWFFGGVQIAITNVAMRDAALDLMGQTGRIDLALHAAWSASASLAPADSLRLQEWNVLAGKWYAWLQCAFLFGAAAGGYLFGRLGDRWGRVRALSISILWFSLFTGATWFVQSPAQLLAARFLACLGIGGTWPNGVALVSEAWSKMARPIMASLIGMAGNVGIFAMGTLAGTYAVTPDSWRWVLLVGAAPAVLGIFTWMAVREPAGSADRSAANRAGGALEVFGHRYRRATLVGIGLATVPLVGGWGSANWMVPWAAETGSALGDEFLKARVIQWRSVTSILGSFLAGWIACAIGRRSTYLLSCLGALVAAQVAFWFTSPASGSFMVMVALLGLFNGIFFGWLPFFLPELFDSRVRATGAGVSFNFGRILTALTLLVTGATMQRIFGGYAEIGRVTSLVFALGVVLILLAPRSAGDEGPSSPRQT